MIKDMHEIIEQVRVLKYQGYSASNIAKQLGLAESQVRNILQEIAALEEQDEAIEFEIGGTEEEVLQRIKDNEARAALLRKDKEMK